MSDMLIDHLIIDGHFTRSVAIARDLHDPSALDGYQVTPSVISVLTRIGDSIQAKSAQRAWKIIGPYGSGKSALGLMLANLLSKSGSRDKAMNLVENISADTAEMFRASTNHFPLIITGSRSSLSTALAVSIRQSIEDLHPLGRKPNIYQNLDLENGTYRGEPIASATSSLLIDFNAFVKGKEFDGVLVVIDEMGKFIEYAATFPDQADLFAFQQVAETASGNSDQDIYVIGLLHQHLELYAADLGRKLSDEWSKVAARFEEIVFDEPIEQYAYFAASALNLDKPTCKSLGVSAIAISLQEAAIKNGFLKPDSKIKKSLLSVADKIYPIHPSVIASLAVISKRYGQSERSLHSFLRGGEAHGLMDFAKKVPVAQGRWYTLSNLFDHFTQGGRLRFRSLEMERRWDFAQNAIERNPSLEAFDVELMKVVAVLELVAPVLGISINEDVLAYCFEPEKIDRKKMSVALERLVDRSIFMRRRSSGEFGFAIDSVVNIEALYEDAGLSLGAELLGITGAQRLLVERRIVAHRYYQNTGTIRTLSVSVGSIDSKMARNEKAGCSDSDGTLLVTLAPDTKSELKRARGAMALMQDKKTLGCIISVDEEAKRSLEALSRWMIVKEKLSLKRIDPWTENYVDLKLQEVRQVVELTVLSQLEPSDTRAGSGYYYMGQPLESGEKLNVSQAASWMFEKLYPDTPFFHNELINRDRLTSPIVQARQRLVELLMNHGSTALLGINGFPPERLIYSTLLHNTRLHRMERAGHWVLAAPDERTPTEVTQIWKVIATELQQSERPTFGAILAKLAEPPIGLRAGSASVLLATYLLVNRSSCAVFERGTLVLNMMAEHFARMFKNPEAFELREFETSNDQMNLLRQYASALVAIGSEPECATSYLDIARNLILWYARLPSYAKETLLISGKAKRIRTVIKKSTDPIALLTHELPSAIFGANNVYEGQLFADDLVDGLTEICAAERRLRDEIVQALGNAFGITGPIRSIRSRLQEECASIATELADFRLRSFLIRCADVALTDDKWLESIASLVAKRPLESWDDQTILEFREEVEALASRYKRWIGIVMQKGRHQEATQRFLGVTLTTPLGEEESVIVTTSDRSNEIAEKLLNQLREKYGQDQSLVASVLAQAFVKMQHSSPEMLPKEDGHGQRKTS